MYKLMRRNTARNQDGFVSIVVTLILMIVLSLIVISFAKISTREERDALDRQLSTQAFYAAESGVNDSKKVIENWLVSDPSGYLKLHYMSDCTSFATAAGITLPYVIPGSGAASYTCLFVDPSPQSIVYSKSDDQHVFPLSRADGSSFSSMEVYWDDGSGGTNFLCASSPGNNPPSETCDAPVLRVELVDNANLAASKVFFVYPGTSGGSVDYGASGTGTTATGSCTSAGTPNKCKIVFSNMTGTKYFVRIKSIYKAAALTITADNGTANLVGAQVIIDATGKATDVERRIQVRLQANDLTSNVPLYGLEGTDTICKRFSINGQVGTDEASPTCWANASTPN